MSILGLDSFIGNSSVIKVLRDAASAGKLPHAVIFAGREGVGKFSAALSLSALLMCSDRKDGSFCGVCRHCRLIEAGTHPDLRIIKLEDQKKEIGIDSIREFIQTVQKKPFLAASKSAIIDPADLMSEEASNALLKVLEEPPGDANIFLITSRPASLLPTIHSRSQLFRFSAVSSAELEKLLVNRGYSAEEAKLAAAMSDGSIADALQWDKEKIKDVDETFEHIKKIVTDGDYLSVSALSGRLSASRERFDSVIGYCYSVFRDLLSIKTGCDEDLLINRNRSIELKEMSGLIETEKLYEILDGFDTWLSAGRRNLNLKMNSEDFVIKLVSLHQALR